MRSWEFQSKYPTLYSEYTTTIPEYFKYITSKQGMEMKHDHSNFVEKYSFRTSGTEMPIGSVGQTMSRAEDYSLDANTEINKWSLKNIPSLVEEAYVNTLQDYISKVNYQLQYIQYPNQMPKNYTTSWEKLSEELLEHSKFGAIYKGRPSWLKEELSKEIGNTTNNLEIAKKCYYFINHNISSKGRGMYATKNLKDIYKEKVGNVADVNMLLIAALHCYDIDAKAVVLGTRDNGITNPIYPLLDNFNYTICAVKIDTSVYILDASVPDMPFNMLSPNCYNGYCRVISENPVGFELNPNSLFEDKTTTVFIDMNEKGDSLAGSYTSTLGNNESRGIRNALRNVNASELFKSTEKEMELANYHVQNFTVENTKDIDKNIELKYDFSSHLKDDIIYFTPMLNEGETKNPFTSSKRYYPVEFPYSFQETYILNMAIPTGYTVDEMPKSVKINYESTNSFFEYIIRSDGQNIQLRSRIKIGQATIETEEYQNLKNFYSTIIKKHAEQIVFKKIKK